MGVVADRRSLVLRALETVEEVGTHLHLTEVLVRQLAQLDVEDEPGSGRIVPE